MKEWDHAIGFEIERPLEILIRCGEGLEVVCAVEGRRSVRARSAFGQLFHDVGMIWRALEHEVLQEVRHACLPIAFVTRAHEKSDIHSGRGFAGIREEYESQAVVEAVLGDPLDLRDPRDLLSFECAGDEAK